MPGAQEGAVTAIYDHNQGFDSTHRKESPKAYEALTTYLQLGSDRSLRQVANILGCSLPNVERWSCSYAWADRAAAWDADQVRQRFAEVKERRDEKHRAALQDFRDRQEKRAKAMGDAADLMLRLVTRALKHADEAEARPDFDLIDRWARSAAGLVEGASNTEATVLGVDELFGMLDDGQDG